MNMGKLIWGTHVCMDINEVGCSALFSLTILGVHEFKTFSKINNVVITHFLLNQPSEIIYTAPHSIRMTFLEEISSFWTYTWFFSTQIRELENSEKMKRICSRDFLMNFEFQTTPVEINVHLTLCKMHGQNHVSPAVQIQSEDEKSHILFLPLNPTRRATWLFKKEKSASHQKSHILFFPPNRTRRATWLFEK